MQPTIQGEVEHIHPQGSEIGNHTGRDHPGSLKTFHLKTFAR